MEMTADTTNDLELERKTNMKASILPKGWIFESVDNLFSVIRGASFPKEAKKNTWSEDRVACLRTANVQNEIEWKDLWFIDKRYIKSAEHIVHPEDIIISTANSLYLLGKCAIVKDIPTEATWGAFIVNLRHHSPLVAKYLYYYLLTNDFKNDVNTRASTTTNISNISVAKLKTISIKVAPLSEQHRIVEKIEELFSEIDKGVESLEKAKAQLEVYRQAVIKAAYEGKFTSLLRDQKVTTSVPLIKNTNSKSNYEKFLKHVKDNAEVMNMHIPEGWVWCSIMDISDSNKNALKAGPFGSSLKKDCYVDVGYKVYGQEQVISGNPFIGDYYIDEDKYQELKSNSVNPGDVLISLVGTVGKVLILPDDALSGIINPRLIKITLNNVLYFNRFFKYYFESAMVKQFYSTKTQGSTMNILNMSIIKTIPFLLPSLKEQHQIVQEIESRLSVCDKVEESIEQGLKQAEMLKQSVLKKAFEGKLVPQNPEDEPASVLLERIRQERESLGKVGKESAPKAKKKTAKGKKS